MIVLAKLLLATALIAGLIIVAMLAGRRHVRHRLEQGPEGEGCEDNDCHAGCGGRN
jgi:hypothetical protein